MGEPGLSSTGRGTAEPLSGLRPGLEAQQPVVAVRALGGGRWSVWRPGPHAHSPPGVQPQGRVPLPPGLGAAPLRRAAAPYAHR